MIPNHFPSSSQLQLRESMTGQNQIQSNDHGDTIHVVSVNSGQLLINRIIFILYQTFASDFCSTHSSSTAILCIYKNSIVRPVIRYSSNIPLRPTSNYPINVTCRLSRFPRSRNNYRVALCLQSKPSELHSTTCTKSPSIPKG